VTEVISSISNPLVKRVRKLRQKKHRDEQGAFLVEGIRPVWSAVSSDKEVEAVIVAPDLLTSDDARDMLAQTSARVIEVTPEVFEALAEREHPSGISAVVKSWSRDLVDLKLSHDSIVMAIDDPGSPGNLGTILRTADAAGVAAVVLTGSGTDPFHPTAVKASMGTLFSVPIHRAPDIASLVKWCQDEGVATVATSARARSDHWDVEYPAPAVLLFGSEATGLPRDVVDGADISVRIPMGGDASSLNLAVAAGIIVFEVVRERKRGSR
jgi:RNA methyltransferase, TrmH family